MSGGDERAELIRKFKAGDEQAFQTLFVAQLPVLRGRVARVLSDRLRRRLSVADVLQEVGLAAFRGRAGFEDRGDDAFRNWLLGIADNKLHDQLRRHDGAGMRAAAHEVSRTELTSTLAGAADLPSPSVAAAHSEQVERVRRAIETLPPDYREVLHLALERGLLLREVADRMGRSREATKKLYGRALCRLKEACGGLDGGHDG